MKSEIRIFEYHNLLKDIKERILSAQYEALKAVNKELIVLYWDIGRMIVEKQKGETWGKSVVEKLSQDLKIEFPGIKGFSSASLWRMRQFYEVYSDNQKLAPLVREIGWSHNIVIFERCKDNLQREFYIRMIRKMGWTKKVLIHQIENQTYEKTITGQTNFDQTLPEKIRSQAKLAVKDEYTFDFLELGDKHSERELEQALIQKVEPFLLEMGGQFSYIGRQYPLEVSGKEFFIDILLYHRILKCLIALELKIGEFQPEYVGKMQFYLSSLDEQVRLPGENHSIGIIVCKEKDKTIVEYTLRDTNKPIGIAGYTVTAQVPKALIGQLPSPEQIEVLLDEI